MANKEIERYKKLIKRGYTANKSGEIFDNKNNKVGYISKVGYYMFNATIDNERVLLRGHRFIYYFFHNEIPDVIDHIDGNRSNNLLENLRSVTRHENLFNQVKAKGYCWYKRDKKWKAQIQYNNKAIHLGYFDDEQDARNAYLEAKKIYHVI